MHTCYFSVAKSCSTLCDPMDCSIPGFPVLHSVLGFAQTNVHWFSDSIFCHAVFLLLSVFPRFRVFFKEESLYIRSPKYWSFNFSIKASNEYSGLISFRIDWFYLLAVKGSLRSPPAPQFESINSSVFSLLYSLTLKSIHYQWKNNSFAYTEVCWQRSI